MAKTVQSQRSLALVTALAATFSMSACGGDAAPVVNATVRATSGSPGGGLKVVVEVGGKSMTYFVAETYKSFDLGAVAEGTHIAISVSSVQSASLGADVLIDNCFRDSGSCTTVGCTATASYVAQRQACPNY